MYKYDFAWNNVILVLNQLLYSILQIVKQIPEKKRLESSHLIHGKFWSCVGL